MPSDWTTLANLKSYLDLTVTTWDALLSSLITRASRAAENYCDGALVTTTYQETYDGWGQEVICLRHRPVVAIVDVREDSAEGAFAASTVLTSTLYRVDKDPGILKFWGYRPAYGAESIQVNYTAGYGTDVPEDAVLAIHKWAGALWAKRRSDGKTNESLGNYSSGFEIKGSMPEDVREILDQFSHSGGVRF